MTEIREGQRKVNKEKIEEHKREVLDKQEETQE